MQPADRDRTLAAMREWAAKHGQLPTRREWELATLGRPSTRTIDRRWGWQRLVATAGGPPLDHVRAAVRDERQQRLIEALRAARNELGRLDHRALLA
jgi:hypothetical protein